MFIWIHFCVPVITCSFFRTNRFCGATEIRLTAEDLKGVDARYELSGGGSAGLRQAAEVRRRAPRRGHA